MKNLVEKLAQITFVVLTITVMNQHTVQAQSKLGWEIRPAVAVATEDLGDADLNTGFGFEGTLSYVFIDKLSGYAGWSWYQFNADQSFAGTDVDFEETGYTLGLQFKNAIGQSALDYFVRGGAIINHIETENNEGDITADSGHGLGWQLGAGIEIDLGRAWMLKPGIRYRSLSRNIDIGTVKTAVDLNYLSFGIGISRTF